MRPEATFKIFHDMRQARLISDSVVNDARARFRPPSNKITIAMARWCISRVNELKKLPSQETLL